MLRPKMLTLSYAIVLNERISNVTEKFLKYNFSGFFNKR